MIKDQELNDKRKYRNSPEKEGKWNGPRASDSGSTNAKQPMKNQQRAAKKHWPATKYYAIYMEFTYLEQGHCSLIYANPQEISFCGFKVDKSVLQPVRLMMSLGRLTKKTLNENRTRSAPTESLYVYVCVCPDTQIHTNTSAYIFIWYNTQRCVWIFVPRELNSSRQSPISFILCIITEYFIFMPFLFSPCLSLLSYFCAWLRGSTSTHSACPLCPHCLLLNPLNPLTGSLKFTIRQGQETSLHQNPLALFQMQSDGVLLGATINLYFGKHSWLSCCQVFVKCWELLESCSEKAGRVFNQQLDLGNFNILETFKYVQYSGKGLLPFWAWELYKYYLHFKCIYYNLTILLSYLRISFNTSVLS